jgi:hypothetical protein
MDTANPNELLTPAQAARLKGVSRQWISNLIRQEKLGVVKIAGRNFVRQSEVLNYKAAPKPGRPPKAKPDDAPTAKRATTKATTKKGGKKS